MTELSFDPTDVLDLEQVARPSFASEVMDHLPVGVVVVAADGTVVWANPAGRSVVGPTEILGRFLQDLDGVGAELDRWLRAGPEAAPLRLGRQGCHWEVRAARGPGGCTIVTTTPASGIDVREAVADRDAALAAAAAELEAARRDLLRADEQMAEMLSLLASADGSRRADA